MSVIDKIKIIVDRVGGLEFKYDDWNRINKRVGNMATQNDYSDSIPREGYLPACFVILPAQGSIDTAFANYRDMPMLSINFCIDMNRASLPDFDGLENESLIELMKKKAKDFIYHYNNSGLFSPLPNIIEYRPLYNILADSLTGISLNIKAEELDGDCYIYGIPVEEEEIEIGDGTNEEPIETEAYYTYTAENATERLTGYYSYPDEKFVSHHDYWTYTIPVSMARGLKLKYTGFVDRSMIFFIPDPEPLTVDLHPIQEFRHELDPKTETIIITTRADVPFKILIGNL